MSQQQLVTFMERLVRELQEGMPIPRRVRLIAEGTTFETWEPIVNVGIDPKTWAEDAETLIQALIQELPKRRIQLSFIAEDTAGATIATLLRTVSGTNASVQDLGTQNGAKALADALASVAKTSDHVLEQARKMLEYQASLIDKQAQQLADAHELFMAIKKVELEGEEQNGVVTGVIVEQLKTFGPMLMEVLEKVVTTPPKAPAAKAAENGFALGAPGAVKP